MRRSRRGSAPTGPASTPSSPPGLTGCWPRSARRPGAGKFTFAELEEIEQDLDKLAGWLDKIGGRDFFPGQDRERAGEALQRCREAVARFAGAVYAAQGLGASGEPPAGPRRAPDAAAADGRVRGERGWLRFCLPPARGPVRRPATR
jgi:hypothetical protein